MTTHSPLVLSSFDQRERIEWINVNWAEPLCPIEYAPRVLGGTPQEQSRTQWTIDFFGLNDRKERMLLVRDRIRACNEAMALFDDETPGKRAELRRLASRYHPHGMTVHSLLEDFAKEISLPSTQEEIAWLLEDVGHLLELSTSTCQERPLDEEPCAQVEQLFWMLAALWRDPPPGTRETIERWLDKEDWRELVEPFRDELA